MTKLKTENYLIRYDIKIDGVTIRESKLISAPGGNAARYRLATIYFNQGIPCRIINCQYREYHQDRQPDIAWNPPQVDAGDLDA